MEAEGRIETGQEGFVFIELGTIFEASFHCFSTKMLRQFLRLDPQLIEQILFALNKMVVVTLFAAKEAHCRLNPIHHHVCQL